MGLLIRTEDTQGFAFETISVTSATVGQLSAQTFNKSSMGIFIQPKKAIVTVENDAIRYMYDGATTVTSTIGHLLGSTGVVVISGIQNISNVRFSATVATALLQVTYER